MKLGEVAVIHVYHSFTKLHQNWMKNKKVLLIARLSVKNFEVSVELLKSYIVQIEQEGKAAASNDITKGLHFLSQVARATFLVSVFTPICLKIAQLTKRMKAVARAATR